MSNLRELRTRLASVKSTRKITSAMKMVAAARLRQAQEAVSDAGYYSASLARIMLRLGGVVKARDGVLPPMISGRDNDKRHLVIVFASSRGLCGGFNINVVKKAAQFIRHLKSQGRTVRLICVGAKAADMLRGEFGTDIVATFMPKIAAAEQRVDAEHMAYHLVSMFGKGTIDACSVVYNHFRSAVLQEVRIRPIVPLRAANLLKPFTGENPWGFLTDANENDDFRLQRPAAGGVAKNGALGSGARSSGKKKKAAPARKSYAAVQMIRIADADESEKPFDPLEYDFEPEDPAEMIDALLPEVLTTLIYTASLESTASENGARMTAMENATNNASDIIDDLTLQYNRTRQALITKELTEIISGAEAL